MKIVPYKPTDAQTALEWIGAPRAVAPKKHVAPAFPAARVPLDWTVIMLYVALACLAGAFVCLL